MEGPETRPDDLAERPETRPEDRARDYEQQADEIDALLEELMLSDSGDERFNSAVGKRIGPYLLTAELGRGGMGVVYEAEHTVLRRRVALKMILGAQGRERERMLARFEIEARAMARLSHPNILKILDVSVEGQRAFMVTELAAGGTLRGRIEREGPMPIQAAMGLCEKLARALHHAHAHSIIHRDVKPANVLFDEDGEPLIADFGLAKATDEVSGAASRSGGWLGTPAYMSPEQITGTTSLIDARTDVYALGATLYEMLTGAYPFLGLGREAFVLAVVNQRPRPVSSQRGDVSQDVETIVARCLAKAPADRYLSAEALAEDCRRLLASEPILARPVGRLERAQLWRRRHPRLSSALLVGAGFLLVGAPGVLAWQRQGLLERARTEARREAEQKRLAEAARAEAQAARREAQFRLVEGLTLQADLLAGGGRRGQALVRIEEARRLCEALGEAPFLADMARWALDRDVPVPLLAFATSEPSRSMAISPDARWALLGNGETFGLWDLRTGARLWESPAHESFVTCLAFSANGRRAISGEQRGALKLWDLDERTLLRSLRGHPGEIETAAFCAGEQALSTGADETVKLWDLGTGREVRSFRVGEDGLSSLVVSRAGDLALWCGRGTNECNLWWDLLSWRSTRAPARPTGSVVQAAFSQSGDLAVTGSKQGRVTVWETATGRRLRDYAGLASKIRAVGFARDAERVVAVDSLGSVRVWERATGRCVLDLHLPADAVEEAALSDDGRLLFARAGPRVTRLWLLERGRQSWPVGRSPQAVNALALSADGRLLLSGGKDGTARLWGLRGPAHLASLADHGDGVNGVDLSRDGRRALTACDDGSVALWDLAEGNRVQTFSLHPGPAHDVAFSADDQAAIVACRGLPENLLRLNQESEANSPMREVFPEAAGTKQQLRTGVLTPDGTLTLEGDGEPLRLRSTPLRLWNLVGGDLRRTFVTGSLYDVARIGDGDLIVTGGQGGLLKVWSLESGKPLRTLRCADDAEDLVPAVKKVLPLPDGRHALAVHGGVSLWDLQEGKRLEAWDSATSPATCVAQAHDPAYFFTGHADGRLRLWSRNRSHPLRSIEAHTGKVTCLIAISEDDRLVSAGEDGQILLWDFGLPARRRRLEGILGASEGSAASAEVLGRLYAQGGLWEWAVDALEGATPAGGEPRDLLAECYWESERWDDVQRLLSDTPPDPTRPDTERRLRSALADRRQRALFCFRAGERQLKDADQTAAIESFGQALNLKPGWARALALRGVAHERLGQAEESQADYRNALGLDAEVAPPEPCPLFFLARALWRREKGEKALAIQDIARVLEAGLSAKGLLGLRAGLELDLGDGEAALADVESELTRSPGDLALLTLRIRTLQSLGRQADAVAELDKLLNAGVRTAALYLQRGRALLVLNEVDPAIADFSRVLDLRPMSLRRRANPVVVGFLAGDREEIAHRPEFIKTSQSETRKTGKQVRVASFEFTALESMKLEFCTIEFEDSEQLSQEYLEAWFELARAYGRRARSHPAGDEHDADRSRALDALERAIHSGFEEWGRIHADPDLEPLQGEARYQALMKE